MNYINNAWITSTAIITAGMLTNSYLNGISNLQLFYARKNNTINDQINDQINDTQTVSDNLSDNTSDNNSDNIHNKYDKLKKYYLNLYIFTYIIAITNIIIVATITTKYKKN